MHRTLNRVAHWTARITLLLGVSLSAATSAWAQDVPEVVRERLDEGDRQRDAGRIEEAIASYREARRLGPSVLEAYVSLGALHVAQGELEEAFEVYTAGLAIDPEDRQLSYNAAVIALRLGRLEEALPVVERAVAEHRKDAALYSLQGAILDRLNRSEEALTALETAARHEPNDPQILFRLGNLHHKLGRKEAAIEKFEKAIKKDRKLLRAYYNLGAVLLETGRYDDALEAYEVALEPLDKAFAAGEDVDAVHAPAYQNLGAIHLQREEWQEALEAYGKALQLDHTLPVALYNKGFIHFQLGQTNEARETYEHALEHDPELPLAYLHLGIIEQRDGEPEKAIGWLTAGMPRFDDASRIAALRTLADSQTQLGRGAEVEATYRELLQAVPDDLPARLGLARRLRHSDRTAEARRELEEIRRLAPDHLPAALELAALARIEGRDDEEEQLYEEILARPDAQPQIWPVRMNLALLQLRQGRLDTARTHLEKLGEEKRRSGAGPGPEAQRLIATLDALLNALGDDTKPAKRKLSAVLRDDANFPAALAVQAVLEALEGRPEALLARSQPTEGRQLDGLTQANLGQALWLAGRAAEALPHLEAAAEAYPRWLSLQAALGDIALSEQRRGEALTHLTAASELCNPRADELRLATPRSDKFQTTIGGRGENQVELCRRVTVRLAQTRVLAALDELGPALAGNGRLAAVRRQAEQALAGGVEGPARAAALYVRGTVQLARSNDAAAARDLETALAAGLPEGLRALAHNNAGIAYTRLGRTTEAQEAFSAASSARRPFTEAVLNLGILFDDHTGQPRDALTSYREYVAAGGKRRREVEPWIDRLERIYR